MSYRSQTLQRRMTTGRFTLPAAILVSVACWLLTALLLPQTEIRQSGCALWQTFNSLIPDWTARLAGFFLYALIGYFLIGLNNAFGIIRMRASVQTAVYFLLISVCPAMHGLHAGGVAAAMSLVALFFLFKSYQQERSARHLFHAFLFIGTGSLLFPQLMFMAPLFWIGAYNFQSLNPKSFCASLIGWSLPYWLFLGHTFYHGQMELFCRHFRELVTFSPLRFDFQPWTMATMGYLFLLFLVSAAHCLVAGYEDKIRTRSYLNFLILQSFCLFAYMVLQPALCLQLLPLLLIGVSILAGHLFVLTNSRSSNIFFVCAMLALLLLFAFNVLTMENFR